jgi:hypothetical protein
MQYIKQKSTNKIVYRESPHTDKTLANAVIDTGIPDSDLEVVEENWTDDEWVNALQNQLGYADKRKTAYPSIQDQLDDLYHNGIDGWKATIKVTKDKYPKG